MAANGTLTAVNKGNALVFAADVKNTAHYNQTEVRTTLKLLLCTL